MTGVIATIPRYQFSDATGGALINGTLTTYLAGTTTLATTWQDNALTIANTNPITLDGRGECVLWLDPSKNYKFVLKDSSGVVQWTQDDISGSSSGASLASQTGASMVGGGDQVVSSISELRALLKTSPSKYAFASGYYASGDGGGGAYYYDSTDTTSADNGGSIIVAADGGRWKLASLTSVSIAQFGATASRTSAQNKASLQLAITAVNAAGGGTVLVPSWTPYGYKRLDITTFPSFSGVTHDMLVIDTSAGASYSAPGKDGSQVRHFSFTAQTTPAGQHDGNTEWMRAYWAPAHAISNDSGIANPSVGADDNRRASYLTCVDGAACWQWGQGLTTAGAGKTKDQLTDFSVVSYDHAGGTGGTNIFTITKATGAVSFNGNNSSFGFHVRIPAAAPQEVRFQSMTGRLVFTLQDSTLTTTSMTSRTTGGVDVSVNGSNALSLDSAGQLLLGSLTATIVAPLQSSQTVAANSAGLFKNSGGAGTNYLIQFNSASSVVGSISHNGTTTTYATSSDYRLKENVVDADIDSALSRLLAYRVREFNFISAPDKKVTGFIAHELQDVNPDAVSGVKDGMSDAIVSYDESGDPIFESVPVYQGVDASFCVPDLIIAVQKLMTEVSELREFISNHSLSQ